MAVSNVSNVSNVSSSAQSATVLAEIRPIGASPALLKQNNEPAWRSNGWPPELRDALGVVNQFWAEDDPPDMGDLDRAWEYPYAMIVIVARFAAAPGWTAQALKTVLDTVLTDGKTAAPAELDQLAELIEYRPGVMDEAVAQSNAIAPYFSGLLNFKSTTHPYTFLILAAAEKVGELVVMYWKATYNRPRPSRRSPLLMPPLDVPGHASFPSGHATQSYLIALCLADAMPAAARQSNDASGIEVFDTDALSTSLKDGSGATLPAIPQGPLFRMAERIARNREVLGLHYPSDSRAGKLLAQYVHALLLVTLKSIKPRNGEQDIVELAQAEWSAPAIKKVPKFTRTVEPRTTVPE